MSSAAPLTVGYYPGCSGQGTSRDYDMSCREVCRALGVSLLEIPDWTCCGSTPVHTVDTALSAAVCSRNFAQAESAGLDHVVTPCPACLKNLRNSLLHMEDPVVRKQVDILTGRPLKRAHSVRSVLQLLSEDVGLAAIRQRVTRPLTGLKAVCYYGCLMNRPAASMKFDDPENPMSMDRIMEALGATVLPYPLKVECCGASSAVPFNKVVTRLTGRLLDAAASLGADVVVTACPICQMNLDLRQGQVNRANKTKHVLPAPYFTQLMGWAFGMSAKDLGLSKLAVSVLPALDRAEAGQGQTVQGQTGQGQTVQGQTAQGQTVPGKTTQGKEAMPCE